MANPQADNGYTKIANEIMDNLAKIRIAGEARQMLDVIIRKTYGFNKKEDKISTSQFMELTGLSRIAIPKARRKLLALNIITVSKKGYSQGLTYSIQKDYEKWKPYPKKDTVKVVSKIKHKTPDNKENKRSKNPSFSGRECEICGLKEDNNEYVFHSHHVEWQLDKKRNVPVSDKSSPTILVCWLCHQKIHKGEIKINYNPKRILSPFLVTECIQKSKQVYPKKDTNCIPKSSTQKKERQYTKETIQKTYSPTSKEVRLSTLLLDLILNRKPNFRKPDIQKWSLHINRLLNIDNRTSDEIEKVIKWCQEDDFWCVNILSTEKLRKQIDKLEIKMNNKPNNKGDNYGKIKQHSEGYPEGTPFDE